MVAIDQLEHEKCKRFSVIIVWLDWLGVRIYGVSIVVGWVIRHHSVRVGLVRHYIVRIGLVRHHSVRLHWHWLDSALVRLAAIILLCLDHNRSDLGLNV